MIAYIVKLNDENKGRFYLNLKDAEKQADYLNEIAGEIKYSIEKVELK